jgi:hypothetical protein
MTIKTDKLVERIKPILDDAFAYMQNENLNLPDDFEDRLKKQLRKSYHELKLVAIELLKDPHYAYVAVRYMETPHGPGVASEFKHHLARMYGVRSFNPMTMEEDRKAFWSRWPNDLDADDE